MKDLQWTKAPSGTSEDGPDTDGFFDLCRYSTTVDHGAYTQWMFVEYLLDTKHNPPLFWRRQKAGDEIVWAVAKVPDWPKKPEEKKE